MKLRKSLPLKTVLFLFTLAYVLYASFVLLSYFALRQNPLKPDQVAPFSRFHPVSRMLQNSYWLNCYRLEIEAIDNNDYNQIRLSDLSLKNLEEYAAANQFVEMQVKLLPGNHAERSKLPERILYQTDGYLQAEKNPDFVQPPIVYGSEIINLAAYEHLHHTLQKEIAPDFEPESGQEYNSDSVRQAVVPSITRTPITNEQSNANQTTVEEHPQATMEVIASTSESQKQLLDSSEEESVSTLRRIVSVSFLTNETLLRDSPQYAQAYLSYRANIEFIRQPYAQVTWLAIGGVLFVFSVIYLFVSAGWHPRHEGVYLPIFQRFPSDLLLSIYALISIPILNIRFMTYLISFPEYQLTLSGITTLFFFFILSFLIHATAQIKSGQFLRCTFIFRVCSLLGRGIGKLFSNLSLIWRNLLLLTLILICEFILLPLSWSSHLLGVALFVLFNGFILIVIVHSIISYRKLLQAIKAISEGDLDYQFDTQSLSWNLRQTGEQLNQIQSGMSLAVSEQIKSERFKTELITNVSHDIKTPLTSIITYTDLLANENIDNEAAVTYIEVLKRQGIRLKKLIEDLIEASKASTGNLTVNLIPLNLKEIVTQAYAEYNERCQQEKLNLIITVNEDVAYVLADGRYLWRVLDNLLNNVVKHALPDTRVYFDVFNESADYAQVRLRNISAEQLNITADELMQRFVQGDRSRTRGGSGLGLSIAESLMQIQGGELIVQIDGDLFTAIVRIPRTQPPQFPPEKSEPHAANQS